MSIRPSLIIVTSDIPRRDTCLESPSLYRKNVITILCLYSSRRQGGALGAYAPPKWVKCISPASVSFHFVGKGPLFNKNTPLHFLPTGLIWFEQWMQNRYNKTLVFKETDNTFFSICCLLISISIRQRSFSSKNTARTYTHASHRLLYLEH